jgi:hypothetical protein
MEIAEVEAPYGPVASFINGVGAYIYIARVAARMTKP